MRQGWFSKEHKVGLYDREVCMWMAGRLPEEGIWKQP